MVDVSEEEVVHRNVPRVTESACLLFESLSGPLAGLKSSKYGERECSAQDLHLEQMERGMQSCKQRTSPVQTDPN